jgi:hypothetical protein
MARRKFETFPNLTLRPAKPALGNGRVQIQCKRAFIAFDGPISSSDGTLICMRPQIPVRRRNLTRRLARKPQVLRNYNTRRASPSVAVMPHHICRNISELTQFWRGLAIQTAGKPRTAPTRANERRCAQTVLKNGSATICLEDARAPSAGPTP